MARSAVFGIAALALAAGCGKEAVKLVPVAGTLTVNGKPVPAGSVQLRADPARGNRSMEVPVGVIRPDGRFELETGGKKGVPPGWWKVVVLADNFQAADPPPSPFWPDFPPDYKPPAPLVHERYLSAATSDVSLEVVAGVPADEHALTLNP